MGFARLGSARAAHSTRVVLRRVRVSLAGMNGAQVCRVDVPPAPEPVFVSQNGTHILYVRVGKPNEAVRCEGSPRLHR